MCKRFLFEYLFCFLKLEIPKKKKYEFYYSVDATAESNKLGRLVNHSRNGNLATRIVEVGNTPHLVLIAKEDITSGTEITYDYGDRSRESIQNYPWLAS